MEIWLVFLIITVKLVYRRINSHFYTLYFYTFIYLFYLIFIIYLFVLYCSKCVAFNLEAYLGIN